MRFRLTQAIGLKSRFPLRGRDNNGECQGPRMTLKSRGSSLVTSGVGCLQHNGILNRQLCAVLVTHDAAAATATPTSDISRGTIGFTLRCDFTEDDGMATQKEFRVLVATDGSRGAQAALATTWHFPWPPDARSRDQRGRTRAEHRPWILLTALDHGADRAAQSARRTLSRRWPDVEIEVLNKTPVEGILGEADRFQAA